MCVLHDGVLGLVTKVVPADKAVETALEVASKIAGFSQVLLLVLLLLEEKEKGV